MINQGLGLAHLFGLFFLSALFGVVIDIRQDIPSQLSPGEEVVVSVEISKGDIQGFAKLQLEVPTGLTISAVETQGASFTFADQKAKFIWMALPPEESFTISYNLQVSQTAIGLKELGGRFSYIEDNERKVHELGISTMDIQDAGRTAAEGELITSTEEEAPELDNTLIGGTTETVNYPFELLEAIQGPGDVSAERKITRSGPQDFLVEVSLNKGDIRGFGKLQETIPTGFIAMEKRSADAIFTTQGEVVKFVWLNLPPDKVLEVSYKLRVINATEPHYKIDGEFGYLLNDETQKATLASTPFSMEEEAMAQNEQEESPISEELTEQEQSEVVEQTDPVEAMNETSNEPEETEEAEAPEEEEIVAVEEAPTPEPKTVVSDPEEEEVFVEEVEPVSNVPSPEHGVTYKVQITAAHKDVGREYFISRHKFYDDFGIERHQGWTKYLTGKYGKYADARNRRNDLVDKGHKFPGPFVTAYNDGQRITVQEALMISNQKWVQ